MRQTYYHTCPECGANLDPGEQCDCQQEKQEYQDNLVSDVLKLREYVKKLDDKQREVLRNYIVSSAH